MLSRSRGLVPFEIAVTLLLLASCAEDHPARTAQAEEPPRKRATREIDGGKTVHVTLPRGDEDDTTKAIQRAIDSDAGTVVVPYTGKRWTVAPLELRSELELVLQPGVLLEAKRGAFRKATDSLLLAKNVRDISIIGYGATIRMRKDDYTSRGYEKGEWRHGICLQGATNVKIRGVRIERTGGDGIYIGPTWDADRNTCTNIRVADCTLRDNHRQGITVVSGVDVRIENCLITGTSGTAPQAGVDLEPSHPDDRLTAIHLKHIVAEGNAGSGLLANLSRLSRKSEPISVRIEHCLVRDSVQPGLRVLLHEEHGARGWIEFVDCTVEGTQYAGAAVVWNTDTHLQLRFDHCRWADVARKSGQPPIWLELSGSESSRAEPSVEFKDSIVFDHKQRDAIRVKADDADVFPGIRGVLHTKGPHQRDLRVVRLPNLEIKGRD